MSAPRGYFAKETWPKALLAALALSLFGACARTNALLIRADVDADVVRLNPEQGTTQSLGTTPVRIQTPDGTYVFSISKPGYNPYNLIILDGREATGRIDIDMKSQMVPVVEKNDLSRYGSYLDKLLAAHRAFLRGQFADAKTTLEQIEASDGTGYGVLMLKGNIALLEGRAPDARKYYDQAKAIIPAGTAPGGVP